MKKMNQFSKSSLFSILGGLSLFLSSCSIYNQQFDCPPPSGIPCASVTEIESMIVETDQGSDLIIKPEVNELNHCFWCGSQNSGSAYPSTSSKCNRKVWICNQKEDGCLVKGYYFQKLDVENEDIFLEAEEVFSCGSSQKKLRE